MRLRELARSLLRSVGVDVRRYSERRRMATDAFFAQERLLAERDVRVIFDVGANVGQTATRYAALFPRADIYSFEPFPDAYAELSAAFAGASRVKPQPLAVSDGSGPRRLHQNSDHRTNSLLPTAAAVDEVDPEGRMRTVGTVEVVATTLDEFCAGRGIDGIDLLKMDIQGGELAALRGAARLLSARAIRLVYTEVLFATLYAGQGDFADVARLLRDHGYRFYGLYNVSHDARGLPAWGDAIFVAGQAAAGAATRNGPAAR